MSTDTTSDRSDRTSRTDAQPVPPRAGVGTTIVEVRDIGKSYGAVNALSGVSSTVAAGQVTCVLGDNGAG